MRTILSALLCAGVALCFNSRAASRGRTRLSVATSITEQDRFAGRYPVGKNMPNVNKKDGFTFYRDSTDVRVVGGACSEVLGGANLAGLLREGFELEQRAFASLEKGEPAEVLSIHTSAGVPPQMDRFMDALAPHVSFTPRSRGRQDWCVNLQAEGASAVHAAIDMSLQMLAARRPHALLFPSLDARHGSTTRESVERAGADHAARERSRVG